MSFSLPLTQPAYPFYTGAIAAVEGEPTSVQLGGIEYAIDLKEYRHNGLPTIRQASVDTGVPDDTLYNPEGGWPRYRISFDHGAGQRVMDLEQSADTRRYDRSRGIDPWTKYEATLLRSTALSHAATATTILMTTTATHAYHSDGNNVWRSADLTSWFAITGMAAESVVGLTSDGTDAYIATTDHLYRVDTAGVGVTDITPAAVVGDITNVAFVANRLIVGKADGKLEEVKAASFSVIFDHYQDDFRWTVIFQVGSRIYVGGYAGNRSELYSLTTTDVGALALSTEAAVFFTGELLRSALSYGGSVIFGTSKGVRFASVGGDGALQYGPLIEDAGDSKAIAAEGRFAWFGWDAFPDSGAGVGRLALDTFVDALQPAYASDVYTEASTENITAIVRFANRTVFAVSAAGVFASSATAYVTSGYIDTGEIYFGTVEDKSLSEFRARVNQLITGQAVTLLITDGETGLTIGTGTQTGSLFGVVVDPDGDIANRAKVRITLAGPATSTPALRNWRARAFPIAPLTEEWIVPLIIHSRTVIGAGEGFVKSYDPWTEINRIKNWCVSKEVIYYTEGEHAFRVRVDNFEVNVAEWRDGADWFEMTCKVRLLAA